MQSQFALRACFTFYKQSKNKFFVLEYIRVAGTDMERFIETVRLHPCLWNPDHPDYPELHARGQAWQNVVKAINDDSIPNSK